MNKKYVHGNEVPNYVIAKRLEELSESIVNGNLNDFDMKIPADYSSDADLILSEAARRILMIDQMHEEAKNSKLIFKKD